MNIIKLSKIRIFYAIILILSSLSSSHSYSAEFKYSSSGSSSKMTIVKNGLTKTYYGWGARVRAFPVIAGAGIVAGGALLGVSMATAAAGVAITAIPVTLFYASCRGVSSVLRAAKDSKFPPPGANAELAESSEVNVNLSVLIPVTPTSLIDKDYLCHLIHGLPKEKALINRQEIAEKIINFSGVSSLADPTLNQFHEKSASGQVRNYLVVLLAEGFETEKTKPRELSKHDADFIVSNMIFLHHELETNLINHEGDIANILSDKIKHYSMQITEKQLEGCVLFFMMSDDMARITFVPFS
ncbi:hypothetical protein NX722_15910 [Endozoicomonas gorgoniicola]|uniref:Uncharacterized protein n=1 Tax=Endozoicomonas gorgoniicola TaxID=1234144 RepID=A0ABT3MXG6_9GAMM|nr:hypothetical protein [Endozoicomonas gorgoniicola]MCW7554075.1 hypothetical protein [Endozoicomonas gorgoniicola]